MRDLERSAQIGFAEESKERRKRNRQFSAECLRSYSIEFETKSEGVHLVVTLPDRVIDFWPGTGLFTDRHTKQNGRGVHNLVKKIYSLTGRPEPAPLPPKEDIRSGMLAADALGAG